MTFEDFMISAQRLLSKEQKGLLAVSGGIDSSVLCHLMSLSGHPFSIAHCNFHLRPGDCDRDEAFVRKLASRYDVDLYVAQFDTITYANWEGQSIEEAARNLRYQFFQEVLQGKHRPIQRCQDRSDDEERLTYIATAHHRDDAAETFFINLLRGTGIAGLHGIPSRNGNIVRPLLPFSRDEIEAYAQEQGLSHVEDYTNATTLFLRNRIRHQLMPLLRDISPTADQSIQRTIAHLSDAEIVYRESIENYRNRLLIEEGENVRISINEVKHLSPQRTLLFELLRPYGFNQGQIDDILQSLDSQTGTQFVSHTHRLYINRGELLVEAMSEDSKDTEEMTILGPIPLTVYHPLDGIDLTFELVSRFNKGEGRNVAYFDADRISWPLHVRHWHQGDRFHPFGMKGSQLVSDYFSDHKFSLKEKEATLLLVDNDETILWIIGHRAADIRVIDKTKNILKVTC